MAHNRDYKPEEIAFPDQIITESELVGEMEKSYIDYAMSVIVGRALPDVRDGLKPVHRRILYAMYEDNLTHDKPFRKCATAVGDVLGRYHPHELWETTMDPEKRTLRRITLEDAVAADRIFNVLMGEDVEPRRAWIESNAKYVVNLDI